MAARKESQSLREIETCRALCLETALEQTRRFHALSPRRESIDGTPPTQLIDIAEQRGVAPERRKIFEQKRELASAAE